MDGQVVEVPWYTINVHLKEDKLDTIHPVSQATVTFVCMHVYSYPSVLYGDTPVSFLRIRTRRDVLYVVRFHDHEIKLPTPSI